MNPADDATTAAWVQTQTEAVLASFDDLTVERALPVLLLMLADAYGTHRLDPDMQDELLRIGGEIGLDEAMSDAEAEAATLAYVEGLGVDEDLLRALKQVHETHHTALETQRRKKARGFDLGLRRPMIWARPEVVAGTPSNRFAAEMAGRIFVR